MAYRQCTRCVMDNASDTSIHFDDNGYCNYCIKAINRMQSIYFPNLEGENKLKHLLDKLKKQGKGKPYDCIIGLSGGLDSAYLAYLGATRWGLRILAVHVDDGFNTAMTETNIRDLCRQGNITLHIIKPNKGQFNDLIRSFLFAGVPNIVMPQDNVIFSSLYEQARNTRVKSFLSGDNFALENILEQGNTHDAFDIVNIKDIHNKYGKVPLKKFPLISLFKKGLITKYIFRINTYKPLNYINYNKQQAIQELSTFCGFEYYGGKHLENSLTQFAQLFWFPTMFGVDKRKSHLSSLIVSSQITREEALTELEGPIYDEEFTKNLINNLKLKLSFTDEEFETITQKQPTQHTAFRTAIFNRIMNKYWFSKK